MRLNDQFRLILRFERIEGKPGAMIVDIRDYH
jgi:plasmid maintenance system killer protein